MTLLSTTTLSGASTVITGINQTYTNLIIVGHSMTNATADGVCWIEMNTLTTGQGNKANGLKSENSFNAADQTGNPLQNSSLYPPFNYDRTSNLNVVYINIQNYASTTFFKPTQITFNYVGPSGNQTSLSYFGANLNRTAGITDISFIQTGGNWSTGSVLIYGVK